MAKELYLYSQIYDFVAQDLIAQMEECQGEDITIRACSPGGSVFSGWGIIAKMQEHTGNLKLKLDGLVASMMLYIALFCEDVECLDVTKFVLHRADMYVGDSADQTLLDNINAQLKAKLTAKIDPKLFKELTGYSIADVFNPEGNRLDVEISAVNAKKLGLVKKVTKLTPAVAAEMQKITANFKYNVAAVAAETPDNSEINKYKNMDISAFKAANPGLYKEIMNKGIAKGIAQEKDRVNACLVFLEIDPAGAKAAIESGEPLTQKAMAEFALKSTNKKTLETLEDESPEAIAKKALETKESTEKEKEVEAFEKATRAQIGLK